MRRHAGASATRNEVVIGVPAYRDPAELRLSRLVALPFGPQRECWPESRAEARSGVDSGAAPC